MMGRFVNIFINIYQKMNADKSKMIVLERESVCEVRVERRQLEHVSRLNLCWLNMAQVEWKESYELEEICRYDRVTCGC